MTAAEVPWPWPGDTELDKRTRICHDYRRELRRLNPDLCDRMDAAAHRLGQHWVSPQRATLDLDSTLPAAEMARHLNGEVSAEQIRQWGARHARGLPGVPRHRDRAATPCTGWVTSSITSGNSGRPEPRGRFETRDKSHYHRLVSGGPT